MKNEIKQRVVDILYEHGCTLYRPDAANGSEFVIVESTDNDNMIVEFALDQSFTVKTLMDVGAYLVCAFEDIRISTYKAGSTPYAYVMIVFDPRLVGAR